MRNKQTWSIVAAFVLLNVHPYMLDFFSVARGYGLSFGFLAASLWFVSEYFTNGKTLKQLTLTLFFAGLAMWANFALLTVFAAMALVIFIALLLSKDTSIGRKITAIGIGIGISALFLGVAYPVLSQLKGANAFFWTTSGLWEQTVCVLAAKLAYPITGDIYHSPHVADFGMITTMLLPALLVGYSLFRNRRSTERKELMVLFGIFLVVMLEVVAQHLLLNAPYPSGRTALFLFVLVIWILASALRDFMLPKLFVRITCGVLVALQLFLAVVSFNFTRTSEWAYCADVRNALREVVSNDKPGDDSYGGVIVGHDIEFGNILSYYLLRDNITNVTLLPCSESEDPLADYYIISPYVTHNVDTRDTVVNYPESELLVLRSEQVWLLQSLSGSEVNRTEANALTDANSSVEVIRVVINDSDSVNVRADIQVQLKFPRKYCQSFYQFWHERNNAVIWSGYYFVEAVNVGTPEVHTVNRNFPLKTAPGDVIRVNIVPADSVNLPVEISHIRTHLRVSQ